MKGNPIMRKCGRPKGSVSDIQRKNVDWYAACEIYIGLQVKISREDFLRSDISGRFFGELGTKSNPLGAL